MLTRRPSVVSDNSQEGIGFDKVLGAHVSLFGYYVSHIWNHSSFLGLGWMSSSLLKNKKQERLTVQFKYFKVYSSKTYDTSKISKHGRFWCLLSAWASHVATITCSITVWSVLVQLYIIVRQPHTWFFSYLLPVSLIPELELCWSIHPEIHSTQAFRSKECVNSSIHQLLQTVCAFWYYFAFSSWTAVTKC